MELFLADWNYYRIWLLEKSELLQGETQFSFHISHGFVRIQFYIFIIRLILFFLFNCLFEEMANNVI